MPDKMCIAQSLVRKKQSARSVSNAPGDQPQHRRPRNRQRKRTNENESEPPRPETESHRKFPMTQRAACPFHADAEQPDGPHDAEHGQAATVAKGAERHRALRSGH